MEYGNLFRFSFLFEVDLTIIIERTIKLPIMNRRTSVSVTIMIARSTVIHEPYHCRYHKTIKFLVLIYPGTYQEFYISAMSINFT